MEGREVLKDKGLFGLDETWTDLIGRYSGNPLALKVASEMIREVFDGDIAHFLNEEAPIFGGIRDLLGQQFARLSELEQEIMLWLAIEREAISPEDLHENILRLVSKSELVEALRSLRRRSLIEKSASGFTLQNVVMEYVTERLIGQVCQEVTTEAISIFLSHALIKAQSKDYVRESQIRLILKPLANRLRAILDEGGVEGTLMRILSVLREAQPCKPGYAGGNTINLMRHLGHKLQGYDFSHLAVWQAYLQGVNLHDVNFAYADIAKSVFTGTFGTITSVAFSPNGTLLAAGTSNGEIRLWQITDGTQLLTCEAHTSWVNSVAFSPDGSRLASGGDHTVRLWEISSGQCLKTLQGHTSWVNSVALSTDGSTLASSSDDGTMKLWSVQTGECLRTLQPDPPYERMNITGVTGLTEAQKASLRALGAVED